MKSKKNIPILIAKVLVLLLCVLYLVSATVVIITTQSIRSNMGIIVIGLTLFYMFAGYKLPHGNLLRYLFIIVALEALFSFWNKFSLAEKIFETDELLMLLEMVIVAYVAGRLNKFKKNILLLCIALLLVAIPCYHAAMALPTTYAIEIITPFDKPIILLTLIVSYIARYTEHHEAGLEDKK